jgi:hypothetical protein
MFIRTIFDFVGIVRDGGLVLARGVGGRGTCC